MAEYQQFPSPASTGRGRYYSGTSGLVLAEPNKSAYPPEFRDLTRLEYYAHLHNSLEVNSSFYKVPQAKTFEKWASQVPIGFEITIKLWQGITHIPGMKFHTGDIKAFMEAANRLGDKKGPLLIQLPPSATSEQLPRLEQLLQEIRASLSAAPASAGPPATTPWRLAVEFRHPSWYRLETFSMLDSLQAVTVLQDMPRSKITAPPNGNGDFLYLRFHGPAGDYKGGYPDPVLREQARSIQAWRMSGRDVYVYFNNTIGDAVANLATLDNYVKNLEKEG